MESSTIAVIGMIGTLVGVIIGAGSTLGVKWFELKQHEKRELKKNLLELHRRIEKYACAITDYGLHRFATPDHSLVRNVSLWKLARDPLPELRHLCFIYAPEFSDEFNKILNQSGEVCLGSETELRKNINLLLIACGNFNHQVQNKIALS